MGVFLIRIVEKKELKVPFLKREAREAFREFHIVRAKTREDALKKLIKKSKLKKVM